MNVAAESNAELQARQLKVLAEENSARIAAPLRNLGVADRLVAAMQARRAAARRGPPKPVPGSAKFTELHRKHPGVTCWASCEPDVVNRERDSRCFLALPFWAEPADFRWPVAGHEIVLIGTGASDQRILDTCRALLRGGALRIAIVHGDSPRAPRLSFVAAKAVPHAA